MVYRPHGGHKVDRKKKQTFIKKGGCAAAMRIIPGGSPPRGEVEWEIGIKEGGGGMPW